MRTRTVFASAAALLVLAMCASCGGGGAGGGAGDAGGASDQNAPASVALTWTGSDDVAGYVVHWGTTSGEYSHDVDVQKPAADSQGEVMVVIALDADGVTYRGRGQMGVRHPSDPGPDPRLTPI